MRRDAQRRLAKYTANVNPERLKINLTAVKPLMVESQAGYFLKMATIEEKTKNLIENEGIPVYNIPNYLFFAREIYRISHTFNGLTLSNSGQERLVKWVSRGLDENLLIRVAAIQGVVLNNLPVLIEPPVLTGNADIINVLKGKTFYKDSYLNKLTGTYEPIVCPTLDGNAALDDVLKNMTFYNNDPVNKRTGTLELTGNALVSDVYEGKTFYKNDAKTKLTGTLPIPPSPPASDTFGVTELCTGVTVSCSNRVIGQIAFPLWNGNVTTIRAYVACSAGTKTFNVKGVFYDLLTWAKIVETNVLTQSISTTLTLITLTFAAPQSVTKNKYVFYGIGADSPSGETLRLGRTIVSDYESLFKTVPFPDFPSFLTALTWNNVKHTLYCEYTPTS